MPDNIKPMTREEMYLAAIEGQNVNLPEPITRVEKYLYNIAMNGTGGGGEGGTTNYNALTNKPKINGVELSGNKSAKDFNLVGVDSTNTADINISGTAETAKNLKFKGVNASTLNNTPGAFVFSGVGDPWPSTDWVGLQIGDGQDCFQVVTPDGKNTLLIRRNDSNDSSDPRWTDWVIMLTEENIKDYMPDVQYVMDRSYTQTAVYFNYGGDGLTGGSTGYLAGWYRKSGNELEIKTIDAANVREFIGLGKGTDALGISYGGTGATTAEKARTNIGAASAEEMSETRSMLADAVNAGQKNLLETSLYRATSVGHENKYPTGNSITYLGVTVTDNGDGTFTADGRAEDTLVFYVTPKEVTINSSDPMVLSGCPQNGSRETHWLRIYVGGSSVVTDSGDGMSFDPKGVPNMLVGIYIAKGYTANGLTFKPMICKKGIYDLDPSFQPYAKTNAELTQLQNIIFDTPMNHNGIFRGKDLTGIYTVDELYSKVNAGDFSDLYIGDYITVTITTALPDVETPVTESVDLMIAGFDYYWNCGNTALTKHHLVLIPRTAGFKTPAKMNAKNTTEGGYLNSYMHQTILPCYAKSLKVALNNHLLTYNDYLTNNVTTSAASMAGAGFTGLASSGEWTDVTLALMNEVQVYGTMAFSSSAYDVMMANRQLPVFGFIGPQHYGRNYFWLRSVVSDTYFAYCNYNGMAHCYTAFSELFVRPLMLFG